MFSYCLLTHPAGVDAAMQQNYVTVPLCLYALLLATQRVAVNRMQLDGISSILQNFALHGQTVSGTRMNKDESCQRKKGCKAKSCQKPV